MKDSELDAVYTRLCTTMTTLGKARSELFLARFALLAIGRIGDAEAVMRIIDDAADMSVDAAEAAAQTPSPR